MKRVSSGILNLDSQLGGGFPAGSVVLMIEDPGAGAEVFSYHFIHEGIKNGEKSLYVSTNDTAEEVKESMMLYLKISENDFDGVKFLDFMGARVGSVGLRESLTLSGDPYNRVITECAKDYRRVVINNLGYFAEDYDRKTVLNMLESMAISARKNESVVFVLFTKGMFEPSFETAVKQAVDGIIELSLREAETEIQRRLKVIKLKRTLVPKSIFRYDITDRGIKMESVTRVL